MTLSDKKFIGKEIVAETFEGLYREENVKESIRNIQDKLRDIFDVEAIQIIDEEVGDELI